MLRAVAPSCHAWPSLIFSPPLTSAQALWLCSAESSNADRDDALSSDDVCALAEDELSQQAQEEPAARRRRHRHRHQRHRRRLREGEPPPSAPRHRSDSEGGKGGDGGDGRALRKHKKNDGGDDDDDDDRKKSREKKIKTKAMKAAPRPPSHTCLPGFSTYVGKVITALHFSWLRCRTCVSPSRPLPPLLCPLSFLSPRLAAAAAAAGRGHIVQQARPRLPPRARARVQ